ncbi:MAG: YidC/Oxa1 family membrane protein insertase [Candidatus Taylorbacteria bacterium]|nr:YidC/Oxa1 family membrane protein insertase [Candidatus Taylorbacteria bacterium]
MTYLYHALVSVPLYNGFILLFDVIPWLDAGMAVIIFTIIVKLILFPLAKKSVVTQLMMKKVDPEVRKIKAKYPNDNQKQYPETMALYKKHGINPLSSIFLLLVQLPILLALYSIFYSSGLPKVDSSLLYSFVSIPHIDMFFLGFLDISKSNWIIALLAAISQYYQIKLSVPAVPPKKPGETPSFQDELARSMGSNMKYVFPVVIFIISFKLAAALGIYWVVSNLFMIGQELFVKIKLEAEYANKTL